MTMFVSLLPNPRLRAAACLAFGLAGSHLPALAQGDATPIQSPQDAACRNEARAKVFTAPDPQGLGLYGVGRQIYASCMRRAQGKAPRRRAAR